jgi:rhodanese-related sulfurtransferase
LAEQSRAVATAAREGVQEKLMKKLSLVIVSMLGLASFGRPAYAAEPVDPAMVSAAEKMLATMPADFYALEPAAAQQQIENAKPFLLDVRETGELASGKLPNSVHIPIRELPKANGKLPENKAAPILAYCKSGYRSGMALTILRMWGYTNVRTIKGGVESWEKAGLTVEKPAKKS